MSLGRPELGAIIGHHYNTLLSWENGDTEPTITQVLTWAAALEVTMDFTMHGPSPSDREVGAFIKKLAKRT